MDLKAAFRQVSRRPGIAIIALCSIAVTIGFTTAISSVVYSVLLHPFPYKGAERMGHLTLYDHAGDLSFVQLTGRQLLQLQELSVVDGAIAYAGTQMLGSGNDSVNVRELSVNAPDYYGIHTAIGRDFAIADAPFNETPAAAVILSYPFWKNHFGGERAVIGNSMKLNGQSYTIIGVTPKLFFSGADNDVYVPLKLSDDPNFTYLVDLRLKAGISFSTAEAAFESLFQQFVHDTPTHFPTIFRPHFMPLVSSSVEGVKGSLQLLSGAVSLLLLAGCLNVAILLLAQGSKRESEFAMRVALGASRVRLIRQVLIESTLLALIGGLAGVLIAFLGLPRIMELLPPGVLPLGIRAEMRVPSLLFSLSVALLTGVLFGISPALKFSRTDIIRMLGDRSAGISHGGVSRKLHDALIVSQVALGLLLLISGGSAIKTFKALYETRLNYVPHSVLTGGILLNRGEHQQWQERVKYFEKLLTNISGLPQVSSISMTYLPLPPVSNWLSDVTIAGERNGQIRKVNLEVISSDFFRTLQIRLFQGEMWTASDDYSASRVAVINKMMMRQLWPSEHPIGSYVNIANLERKNSYQMDVDDPLYSPGQEGTVRVIGVVEDTPNDGLDRNILPSIYVPFSIVTPNFFNLVIRTKTEPLAVVRAVQQQVAMVNSKQIISQISTADDVLVENGWAQQQFTAVLLSLLSLAATSLVGIGLYSVLSYIVSQRAHEFGVRMALGASKLHIVRLVSSSVGGMVCTGIGGGIVLSALLKSVILDWTAMKILDAPTIFYACFILVAISMVAVAIPIFRATSIEPMRSLRGE